MESRDRALLVAAVVVVAVATGLAFLFSGGTVDTPGPPPVRPGTPLPQGTRAARGLPPLVLPPDFPAPARALLEETHRALAAGSDAEATGALRSLAVSGANGPLGGSLPAALEAMAPSLEWLITEKSEEALAGPALRAAAGLARAGGDGGRRALERTGLVTRAFALQGAAGTPELRTQAALLLGFVATDHAVEWLASFLARAAETEVREAAAVGLREAHRANGTLPPAALRALQEAFEGRDAPPAVRRACLDAFREAYALISPYPGVIEGIFGALSDPDPGTRLAAANFLLAHPVTRGAPAVLARLREEPDERVVEVLAQVLVLLRPGPPGSAAAIRERLPSVKDERALAALREALRSTGAER